MKYFKQNLRQKLPLYKILFISNYLRTIKNYWTTILSLIEPDKFPWKYSYCYVLFANMTLQKRHDQFQNLNIELYHNMTIVLIIIKTQLNLINFHDFCDGYMLINTIYLISMYTKSIFICSLLKPPVALASAEICQCYNSICMHRSDV